MIGIPRGVRDPDEWERLLRTELEPRLARSIAEARSEGFLDLQAAYGYWPALADGDTVLVYDPDDRERVVARLTFPRQPAQHRLCLADYLRPVDEAGGARDVIALQLATTGPRASEVSEELQRADRYDDMLRVHGFATQMAEATAEHVHGIIRAELGLGADQGRRYSPGAAPTSRATGCCSGCSPRPRWGSPSPTPPSSCPSSRPSPW